MSFASPVRRLVGMALVAVAVLAALTAAPADSHAADSQYTSSSFVKQTVARIRAVRDGDSFFAKADFNKDGAIEERLIRLVGADSPEGGYCGYDAAKNFTKKLLTFPSGKGRLVTLTTDKAGATGINNRLLFRTTVERDGKTLDLTEELLERGLGVWLPYVDQPTNYQRYHRVAETAAAAGKGIFRGDYCTAGPAAANRIDMDVQWEADDQEVEHARIMNHGPEAIDFTGWIIRAGGTRRLRIPSGPPTPAGEMLTIFMRNGTDTANRRFMGNLQIWPDIDVFDSPYPNGVGGGDGGYLLDPGGDVRAWQIYNCTRACGHPAMDKIQVTDFLADVPVCNDGQKSCWSQEYVEITNTSAENVIVGRLVIDIAPWTVELPRKLTLLPGEHIRVHSGDGTPNQTIAGGVKTYHYYLNADEYPPLNTNDRAVVRTYPGTIVECRAWGTARCS